MSKEQPLRYSYIYNYERIPKDKISTEEHKEYNPYHVYNTPWPNSWSDFKKKLGEAQNYVWDEAKYFYNKCVVKFASQNGFEMEDDQIKSNNYLDVRQSITWLYKYYSDPKFPDDSKKEFFFEFNGLDKDQEIREVVSYLIAKKSKVRILVEEEPHILNAFSKVLLERYNLDGVKEVELSQLKRILKAFVKLFPTEKNRVVNFLTLILIAGFFLLTLKHIKWLNFGSDFVELFKIFPLSHNNGFNIVHNAHELVFTVQDITAGIIVEGIIIVIFLSLLLALFKKPNIIKLLLPRLFAGVVVGYLPLVIGDEVWKYAIFVDKFTTAGIVISSLIISFIYVRYEISNIIGNNKKEVLKRTFNIFSKGVIYSFSVGIIILDLLNAHFINNMKDIDVFNNSNLHAGILGIIDPKVLLVFFPLALLIGIFVQIIWEDKPITEPL